MWFGIETTAATKHATGLQVTHYINPVAANHRLGRADQIAGVEAFVALESLPLAGSWTDLTVDRKLALAGKKHLRQRNVGF